jgi:hypothetical protein
MSLSSKLLKTLDRLTILPQGGSIVKESGNGNFTIEDLGSGELRILKNASGNLLIERNDINLGDLILRSVKGLSVTEVIIRENEVEFSNDILLVDGKITLEPHIPSSTTNSIYNNGNSLNFGDTAIVTSKNVYDYSYPMGVIMGGI